MQQFRFGAQHSLTPGPNSSRNRSDANPSILNFPISTSFDFHCVHIIPAPSLQSNNWRALVAVFGSLEHQQPHFLISPFSRYARLFSRMAESSKCQTTYSAYCRSIMKLHQIFHSNLRLNTASSRKCFILQDAGDTLLTSTWRRNSAHTKGGGVVKCRYSSLSSKSVSSSPASPSTCLSPVAA